MALLDEVKIALRISASNTNFDTEIANLISAARLDLIQAGVSDIIVNQDTDELVKRAIIQYTKANFGYDNPEAARFEQSYINLKQSLSQYGGYKDATS